MRFDVGQRVFYYGDHQRYHGGVYKIVGRFSETRWRLKGSGKDVFIAEEKDLQPIRVVYDRFLDDLM